MSNRKDGDEWKQRLAAMPEWLQEALEHDPDLILWDGLDEAIVATAERCGMGIVLVYDYEKMMKVFMDRDGMTQEDAMEWIDFNIVGAYVGQKTPITLYPPHAY